MPVAKTWAVPLAAGARERKQQSTRRSVAYYRDPVGKQKKRALNGKRTRPKADGTRPAACPPRIPVPENRDAAGWPPRMLAYVQMVVSLIEARAVSRTEILQMLQRVLRQRTMARRRQIDHAVSWLHEHPP